MRIAFVIVCFGAIGWGLVQIKRVETRACYRIQQLERRRTALRTQLINQQYDLAALTQPRAVWRRVEQMGLNLIDVTDSRRRLAIRRERR